jgi:5-(hydroxymethyl)furfural/furfural oxidase
MKAAVRKMFAFLQTSQLATVCANPFAETHGAMAAMVGQINLRNWLMTIGPALLLDGPSAVRRRVVDALLAPGADLATAMASDDELTAIVRQHTIGGWHASGTCRIGRSKDLFAVVSPANGNVYGVEGLSVIDASIMPTVPRANTNIPTIMLAEKMVSSIN